MANRNHFTEKFSAKSDQELRAILESPHHVDEAKLAAKWILEERGEQTEYQPPKKVIKKSKPWIPERNQDPEHRKHYEWRMLAFGVACIIGAFYINYQNLITTKYSLTELKGTIQNSDVIVDNVSSRNRMGYEAKSRRATLYFRLNEHQKLFKLVENIEQDYSHEDYERISKSLNNSKTASVWINKSELNSSNPKVFQIDVNEQTILDFNTVKSEHAGIFIFMLLLGTGMTGFALYSKYPEQMRKILRLR
jgi:hypothetical protein